MRDLANHTDVEELVVAFYRAAFADTEIGPVFTGVAQLDLDHHHRPIMCDFWETVLFNADRPHTIAGKSKSREGIVCENSECQGSHLQRVRACYVQSDD